ncbi:phage DNA ejection protein [Pseudescherichia sp.]|uniref:phage DNA ejection protein n=1 Tax=Pseudescherichia sp. TaxID=2055881 RepID=UPI0028A0E376|nr:phage DNA ejection protein [Pseudescherichia sp.]
MVDPIDYSAGLGRAILVGNQAAQGIQQVRANRQQMADQEAAKATAIQFQQDWKSSFGDPQKMTALAAKYPGQMEAIKAGIGFQNEQHQIDLGNAARDLRIAIASGNPQAIGVAASRNAGVLGTIGSSPEEILQQYQQDPQSLAHIVDAVGLSALGPKDYYGVTGDRAKLAEQIRSNQAGEALTARGQDITVRGQNISAQNAALSREIQKAELQDKALDRQIARETNTLKLEELRQKQTDVRQKAEVARADRQATAQGAVDTFSTALDSLGEIEKSPGLAKAVGVRSAFPTIPGSDAANFEARLDTFKAQTFLPMVASLKGMGALSDAEGKKLSDAVGALSPKMSEDAFRSSIGKIRTQLESKLGNVKKQFDYQEPPAQSTTLQPAPQPQQQAGFSSLWGD